MDIVKRLKVAAPAKINLTLEVLDKRDDGFHNIKSVMQAIDLYDYLTFEVRNSNKTSIVLQGNSDKIPYDERTLVYKAAKLFLDELGNNAQINIYIEKNIPIEAGLAGGSTDAAATFFALNEMFSKPFSLTDIDFLCAKLGSDLNFCLHGGTAICTGRGEKIEKIATPDLDISLIKPLGFGISAKEAYTKFSQLPLDKKTVLNCTEQIKKHFDKKYLFNSLELAVINDYAELKEIKSKLPNSIMSGSGPTFFVLSDSIPDCFDKSKFQIIPHLHSICDGIKIVD